MKTTKTSFFLYPRSLKHLSSQLQGLIKARLWLQIIIAMLGGVIVGILMGPSTGIVQVETAATISDWLAFPGKLFLALIQMMVIPLVFASIIRGLAATENLEQLKQIGLKAGLFFLVTTVLSIAIGLATASVLKPGNYISSEALSEFSISSVNTTAKQASSSVRIGDIPHKVVTLLPSNPLSSMVENNMLQVVIFAMVMGIALVMMTPTQAKPLLDLMGSLQEVSMTVVRWAMLLAPYAVFGLMTQLMAKLGLAALLGMAFYVLTVLIALFLLFIFYLLVLFVATNTTPRYFITNIKEVLLLAFSTSSSAAVMPLSIKTAEDNLNVRPSISQFVIPLGATVNMNGTALYQGAAAVFLAQVFNVDISAAGMALIVVTAVGASIGSPATPGVGIVILSMVLSTVGIPPSGIALIMGVDRILDMSRTAINVSGDLVVCKLMDRWVGSSVDSAQEFHDEEMREKIRERTGEDVLTKSVN